ncbi:PREDICTED: somatostatin receptor type 1-like [Fulmarus glacialis]|uniref:somatostatin receptor type 1-like n=1 Tax=Fulmarus glacialis TaxID=30455 RepID=UPI00051C2857|nr:PREDICTED: somatostatin receptor type 1-like [Fulmarus glacialis]
MVIYVILRYAKMKTATNIYILNLAIADELLMLSVPFLVTSTLLHHWPFGSLLCRLVLSVDAINMFTSIYCLTVLSVDRYIAVVHPIKAARYRRPTVAKMVNLGVWVLSILIILPIIIFSNTAANSDGTVACNMLMPEPTQRWLVVFVVYTFLMGFLLPVVAICLCYILIIAKMRMVALKAGWQQRKRSERKITLMVMMVVMVFVICWMPFYIVQLVNVFVEQDDATISQLSVILGYANSCANPILYGFLSDNFKRSFQRLLCLSWMDNAAEEPIDYYATALKSRAYSVEDFPPDNLESGSMFRNGTCTSRFFFSCPPAPLPPPSRRVSEARAVAWGGREGGGFGPAYQQWCLAQEGAKKTPRPWSAVPWTPRLPPLGAGAFPPASLGSSCETAMKGAETVLNDLGGRKVTLAYMEKEGFVSKSPSGSEINT